MLDYEWVNTSMIVLAGNEGGGATEPGEAHRQIYDHNYTMLSEPILHGSTTSTGFSHNHHFNPPHHPFFDPRAILGASTASFSPPPPSLNPIPPLTTSQRGLGLEPGREILLIPKSEVTMNSGIESSHRLRLDLGDSTYFPSYNDDTVTRFYRCCKTRESPFTLSSNMPRCQAEGCNVDLSNAKHYHRRHKVCELHSKASTVIAAGMNQRFCQQCSRFHLLSEFDNGKRSCRKRLADHNRRRRKNQQPAREIHKSQPYLDNAARSSPESGAQIFVLAEGGSVTPRLFPTETKQN